MRFALLQFNPIVGDLDGNADRIARMVAEAEAGGAALAVLPELALSGYPPRDLLNQQGFLRRCRDRAIDLADRLSIPTLLGTPWRPDPDTDPDESPDSWTERGMATNSVLLLRDGRIERRYDKRLLPTYDVFDEHRYFRPGDRPTVFELGGHRCGIAVCEDLWRGVDMDVDHRYAHHADPVGDLVAAGASIIFVPSASPFALGKGERQRRLLTDQTAAHNVIVASVNQVGGNDDLIFDGHAAVYEPADDGPRLIAAGPGFCEHVCHVTIPGSHDAVADPLLDADPMALLWQALVIGVRDYCRKTGFSKLILGLSGGIDSAVTATIAAAAVGAEHVRGITMPSRYSSQGSVDDSDALARNLGIAFECLPIGAPHDAIDSLVQPVFASIGAPAEQGVTEENIQARIRGVILMAFSNKTGALLLNTGNKSELAVGYCTLYGDMNGALAVLSDVPKVDVYRLSRWINDNHGDAGFDVPPIPESTITKPPSAELRPDQTDQDTLPPYEVLDEVIERYVEALQDPQAIVDATGFDAAMVARIVRLIDVNEYKRKQMPIGLKVTPLAFGRGRRRAIAQGYRPDRNLRSAP